MHILIAGAGISGLTIAYRILADAPQKHRVTVVESADRVGGSLITEDREGFLMDGGADAFVRTKPHAAALCKEIGLGPSLQETIPENRSVYFLRRGRLVRLPEGMVLAVPTRFRPLLESPLFSARGILRMGLDLVLPRGHEVDESIASFLGRRLGAEAVELLGEPLLAGIYSGDPTRLSLRSTFPQLAELESKHRSLILGALASKKPSAGPTPSPFLALKHGMGELARTLAERVQSLGGELITRSAITGIDRGYRVSVQSTNSFTIEADRVVLTCPAPITAALLQPLNPEIGRELRAIPHVSTAAVLLAYDRAAIGHPLDASGILIPRSEGRGATAITFVSSKWSGRAPDGKALLRVFFGGHSRPEVRTMLDEDLVQEATHEAGSLLSIARAPEDVRVFRWNDCRPQPVVGHAERVTRIRSRLQSLPGIFVTGAAFDGVGISDCVRQGTEVAARLIETTR